MRLQREAILGAALILGIPSLAAGQEQTGYELGIEARLAGDPQAAATHLELWLAEHPDDADAKVQLGYAYLALDRLASAEAQFRAVLATAPDYVDASAGIAEIVRRKIHDSRRASTLLVDGARSALDGNLEDWTEIGATFVMPIAARDTLEVRAIHYERFGLEDIELGALYTRRADEDTWLRFGASGTPSADFRPGTSLTAGMDRRLSRGPGATVVGIDAAWRAFPAQDVFNLSPAITRYLGNSGNASITARANLLAPDGDTLRVGGSLRADYQPRPRHRAFVGIAAGPDTDVGVVTDTYSLFSGGEVPLGDTLTLIGSVAREWRDGPADRTEFRLGLKVGL